MPETIETPVTAALAGGRSSPTIGKLATALALAQSKIEAASKDKTNPAFRSKYADLGSVWDACREALTANGLAVLQMPEDAEPGRVALRTVLTHSSGEFVQTVLSTAIGKNDAQSVGSALTYLRRYSLAAMVGVAPEDDDGNAASAPTSRQDARRDTRAAATKREPDPTPDTAAADEQRAHDPSWAAERSRFCAALTSDFGVTYDEVKAWALAGGGQRPSAMTHEERVNLYKYLRSDKGRADLGGFLKREISQPSTAK